MDLHLSATFLSGKNILKVKRNLHDPFLWVLAANNQVFRINSLDHAVEDFTSKFGAYSSLSFVDIVGIDDKTVFIATRSTTLLEYKNDQIKVISSSDGILGTINSIGASYTDDYLTDNTNGMAGRIEAKALMIGTDQGMCHYDYEKDVMLPYPSHVPARVFEASHRNQVFSDLEFGPTPGGGNGDYNLIGLTEYTIYGGYIYYGSRSFGNSINTVTYTYGPLDEMNNEGRRLYMNQLWGMENGIFQNLRTYSRSIDFPVKHYLDGIQVNKLTTILGLAALDNNLSKSPSKENVLAGTNDGLYFSNSGYRNTGENQYTFFRYEGLGHKRINDLSVNEKSYKPPFCEDGVWVAAEDGLYLLSQDYKEYFDPTQQEQVLQFDGKSFSTSKVDLCDGNTIKVYLAYNSFLGDKVQWYRNGVELPNESNKELVISEGGEYYAKLFDPCSGLHIETNRLEVNKIAEPVLRFNYPDVINFCKGSQATLATDNNELYQYRWYRNGTLIDGMVSATLANISVAGRYRVEASACNGTWVSTKEVQVNFVEIPKPVLSLDRSGYCDGGEATITAAIIFDEKSVTGWTPYQFYWFKNGVAMGVSGSSIKVKEAGSYKVQAFGCSGVVTSDEIVLSFTKMEPPVITADKPAYCIGDNATIAFDLPKEGTYTIAWYRDGQIISDAPSKTSFTTHTAGSYFASIINDQTGCQVVSTEKAVSFEAPPSISITKVVKTTLCDGEPVDLTASFSGGAVRWSTGETAASIIVKQSGTYQATVTTVAGCSVQVSETVQLYPKPELNLPQATLCQYTKGQVTLAAPGGFVNYEWNGQPGSETYTTDRLGNVSLTVTDHNGCKATQTIAISSRCDDIHIPNTFTPNNDGYNDRWIISGLDGNADATVHVFDRWGNQVFQSKGYAKPWDGTINGKPLTGGTYYYVISAHAGSQIFSGSVTLIL